MIYRINDTIFRPIFAQWVEWAASSSAAVATVHRQTTLYGFLMHFFNRLKVWTPQYGSNVECVANPQSM